MKCPYCGCNTVIEATCPSRKQPNKIFKYRVCHGVPSHRFRTVEVLEEDYNKMPNKRPVVVIDTEAIEQLIIRHSVGGKK